MSLSFGSSNSSTQTAQKDDGGWEVEGSKGEVPWVGFCGWEVSWIVKAFALLAGTWRSNHVHLEPLYPLVFVIADQRVHR